MSVDDDLIRSDALGWMPSNEGKYVCADCFQDYALQEFVKSNAEEKTCTYCGRSSSELIAASLDEVTEHMAICISRVYSDPAEVLPYESREGGYQGIVYEMDELLEVIGFDTENDELREDIVSSFSQTIWTETEWLILDPSKRKASGWKRFKKAVKHERRYTFWSMGDDSEEEGHPDYLPIGNMLDEISDTIEKVDVIKNVEKDECFWRVRVHKNTEILDKDSDFTSPPVSNALQPNRMSPAGIPMFYSSEDYETACLETINPSNIKGKNVSGACFKSLVDLRILDLADLPPIPSFFDIDKAEIMHDLIFLSEFARDISQPVKKGEAEHIEYIPTQAFTEYIRWMVQCVDKKPIDGISYRSSKNGKKCFVLFCEQDECLENSRYGAKRQWLKFQPELLRTQDF